MKQNNRNDLYNLKEQRRTIVSVAYHAKQGHLSSCFSVLEILNVLYKKAMNVDLNNIDSEDNDKTILCKGHASLALYSLFYDLGILSKEQIYSFTKFESILGEHPDKNKIPGIDISTGSLGHGFPAAVGMAIGYKIKKKQNRVFAVVGDGECNEGSIWEAAFVASDRGLDNLTCIVDDNNSECHMPNLGAKFASFGWDVCEVDGNNTSELEQALLSKHINPLFVWAHTKKVFWSQIMQNESEKWHHKIITDEDFANLMEELK